MNHDLQPKIDEINEFLNSLPPEDRKRAAEYIASRIETLWNATLSRLENDLADIFFGSFEGQKPVGICTHQKSREGSVSGKMFNLTINGKAFETTSFTKAFRDIQA